jgi:hypothetical protein
MLVGAQGAASADETTVFIFAACMRLPGSGLELFVFTFCLAGILSWPAVKLPEFILCLL